MKIAFLNITQGLVERGSETFVKELSERLNKNHEVTVFAGDRKPPQRWPILWRFFVDPYGLSILWFTLKNLPKIWQEKFDVVIPVNGGWQPALIRIITWLYGGRMVISGHSGKGWDDRNNLWCFPDIFVALSTYLLKWAKKVNPFVQIKYIPNGVDISKFNPTGKALKTNLKKPIVLCVGALTSTKRIDLTVRAVAKLNDVSLLVVGDGEMKSELERLGKRLLVERFMLIKVPFEKIPEVYRASDAFTIASESFYSFEIVLIEAMSSGLAVVANNDQIRREIVGDAGILVDPTDTEVYARALEKALKTNWGDKPRRQAEKFDWDKIARKYENLFNELVLKRVKGVEG